MPRRETERDTYGGERRWAEGAGESWTAVERAGPQPTGDEGKTEPESARWRGSDATASPNAGTLRKITDELGITEPAPPREQRSDERIREEVCEHLWRAAQLDVSEVSVEVKDAVVSLEGSVPHRQMKHAIEDIAAGCRGVRDVDNKIRVTRAR